MRDGELATYRDRLLKLLEELREDTLRGAEATATVMLDQQSVGRLSRMDALQGQAMARAQKARRAAAAARIRAALARIDEGEFGYCTECGDRIAPERLALDPAVPTCISCARG